MLKIVICEDKPDDAFLLRKYLEKYLLERRFGAGIDIFESAEELLDVFYPGAYQIAFLDIYLKEIDGMQLALNLRKQDEGLMIVFLTTSKAHAMESYAVRAVHYLQKPVDHKQVNEAMDRCGHTVDEHARFIEVFSHRTPVRVRLRDIRYIETYQRHSVIYTARGDVETSATMDMLVKLVGGTPYVRCHRNYLINMRMIERLDKTEVVLKCGAHIPIGRAFSGEFNREYADYVTRQTRPDSYVELN